MLLSSEGDRSSSDRKRRRRNSGHLIKRSCPCHWTEKQTAGSPGCVQSYANEWEEAGYSDGAAEAMRYWNHSWPWQCTWEAGNLQSQKAGK